MGTLWAHFLCSKMGWGAKGAPRGTTTKINSPFWAPFWAPKSSKIVSRGTPKTSSEICPEKVFLKGVILRSSTCLNRVRGLKNQGFDVFRKGPKNEPNRHLFWRHFWIKYDQKWTRKGFQQMLQKRVPRKTQTALCLQLSLIHI